jgi:hypothetical protein
MELLQLELELDLLQVHGSLMTSGTSTRAP